MKRIGGLFCLLMLSIFSVSGSLSDVAGEEAKSRNQFDPKIDGLLAMQVDAKLHQNSTQGEFDMAIVASGLPEKQRVFIHFEQKPTLSQMNELQSRGVIVHTDSWIPPLAGHPTGFLVAEMSPATVYEIADIDSISSMSTAEIQCEPQNDVAAAMSKADIVWNGIPSSTGTGVKIAVLDSGFEINHPDFPSWMTGGENYRDYSTDATGPDDYDVANCCTGHGTHVAGTALGRGTAGSPTGIYKGMAHEATPVLLKIGGDSSAGAWPEAIVAALKAAVDEYNADVINMSYGSWSVYHDGSDEMCQAIDYAVSQGATVFIPAGNDGSSSQHYSGTVSGDGWGDWIEVSVTGTSTFYFNLVWYDGIEASNDLELYYYQSATQNSLAPITTYPQSESPRGTESEISFYGESGVLKAIYPGTYFLRVRNYSPNAQFFHIYNFNRARYVNFVDRDIYYTVISPAEADGAIAVGAARSRNQWWDYANNYQGSSTAPGGIGGFSSKGPRIDNANKPNIVVPGYMIISMRDSDVLNDNNPTTRYISNNGPNEDDPVNNDGSYGPGLNRYLIGGATSYCSPHAAGLAALLLDAHPDWTPDQVRYALESTAVDNGDPGYDNIWGWGLANVGSAIAVSPPTIATCTAGGTVTNRFSFGDTVYVKGLDLEPDTNYKLWIQNNGVMETKRLDVSEDPSGIVETVITNGSGAFDPTTVWTIPGSATSVGEYDIVADNQNSGIGVYQAINDALDSMSGYGLTTGVIYVNAVAAGNNDGTSWKDAYVNLQQALSNAGSPGQIWVAAGTYTPIPPGQPGTRTDSFRMKNGVGIYGGFANVGSPSWSDRDWEVCRTVLSGDIGIPDYADDNCNHVFYHPNSLGLDSTAVLDGFTVMSGNAGWPQDNGGGMYNDNASPSVLNCIFQANNGGSSGGGMYNTGDSSPAVSNCIFRDNNTSAIPSDGGGVSNGPDSSPVFNNCVFIANSSGCGGGMSNYQSAPILTNCVFTENIADEMGGAGLRINASSPIVTNCILWNNIPDEIDRIGGTPFVTYSNIRVNPGSPVYPGTGNISADPQWVNPGSWDFHLKASSPCIDTGTNSAVAGITEDFEADPRIIDGDFDGTATVDMGVDEAAETRSVGIFVTLQGDYRPAPAGWEVPISIGFFQTNSGTATLLNPGSALYYFTGTTTYIAPTAHSGTRAFYLAAPVDWGIYDITVDSSTTLLNVKREVHIP